MFDSYSENDWSRFEEDKWKKHLQLSNWTQNYALGGQTFLLCTIVLSKIYAAALNETLCSIFSFLDENQTKANTF